MHKISFKFSQLRRLHLHDYHVSLNAKMVPFAGYEMPVQYKLGVLKEHMACRESCGLFDVSHMGQVTIAGPDHIKFIETLTTGEYQSIPNQNKLAKQPGQSQLCLILNQEGGIIDDTIVAKRDNFIHMVVNAGNKFIGLDHMNKLIKQFNFNVDLQYFEDKPLLAIQGPQAVRALEEVFGTEYGIAKLPFMSMINIKHKNVDIQINRCGYTGEDGFEISLDKQHALLYWEAFHALDYTEFCGLGARDSLRLEAGLCLHGHEMDADVTPYEAKLMWTVRKKDKVTGKYSESVPYFGRQQLLKKQKETKVKRMGFIVPSGIVRPPSDIYDENGKIGTVTSGTYSPVLKKGIGFAFINNDLAKDGTKLQAELRGSKVEIELAPAPFIQPHYYRG